MKHLPLLLPILLVLLVGCGRDSSKPGSYSPYEKVFASGKPISFGEDADIYLFAGAENLERSAAALDSSLTRKILLTDEEQYFNLIAKGIGEIEDYLKYKNLLLLGTLDGTDGVSAYLRRSLAPDLVARVKQSGAELLVVKNEYVRDQLILYLLASDSAKLLELTRQRADQLFGYYLERYQQRLGYQVYKDQVVPEGFFKDRPFTIQVPVRYQIFADDKKNRFLSYIFQPTQPNRATPDKYVSVYYEAMPENKVDAEWVYAKRQELGQQHFNGDQIRESRFSAERSSIAGYQGWRLYGHWINPDLGGGVGGAFQTFAFWHAPTRTAFLVDNIVYFPDGAKLPAILELGVISQSLAVK